MTGTISQPEVTPLPDAAVRERRLAWEAERIAEALESIAAGRIVTSDRVDAWTDSLGTKHELPMPRSER